MTGMSGASGGGGLCDVVVEVVCVMWRPTWSLM